MKAKTVGLLSLCGMLLTSVSVYSLTPEAGLGASIAPDTTDEDTDEEGEADEVDGARELARFSAGETLWVEGKLGHEKLLADGSRETFVLLEVQGSTTSEKTAAPPPVNLALVIDRSGSMKGRRIQNAQSAAIAAVDRLHDGDTVSVITFDTQTAVVVPPTTISSASRFQIADGIRRIQLGGDTCLSCGVEDGLSELSRTLDKVDKMIVLSDGDANSGVRDVSGFRAMGQRARDRGVSITTIGVDLQYNERIMAAIAQEANGRHYFVENESDLSRVFLAETEALTQTVASGARASVELGDGVELVQVFDRSFTRSGNRVDVPLGSFAKGETKTVLLQVRVPAGSSGDIVPVAKVDMEFDDLTKGKRGSCRGELGLALTSDASEVGDLDPGVAGRVERSRTAAALRDANQLFSLGKFEEARGRLRDQRQSLAQAAPKAKAAAPAKLKGELDKDFGAQASALDEAESAFATPPASPAPIGGGSFAQPPPTDAQRGIKKNAETINAFGL